MARYRIVPGTFSSAGRWAFGLWLVAFPAFLGLAGDGMWDRYLRSPRAEWLAYATLFLTAATVVGLSVWRMKSGRAPKETTVEASRTFDGDPVAFGMWVGLVTWIIGLYFFL